VINSKRCAIAWRAAQDIVDGSYVNLGIGIPTLVPAFVPAGREIVYQSENGLLGVGPPPAAGAEDPDLINASKDPVTLQPGAAIFDSVLAFGIMRGGHLDLALIGAFEVDVEGSVANWTLERGDAPRGVGGAMDLAVGAREIWVLMEHTDRHGSPRILERCKLPLTARGVARRIYTDLAVMTIERDLCLTVHELKEGVTPDDIAARTGAALRFSADLRPLRQARFTAAGFEEVSFSHEGE
jgi:3-oxoadipate CoA-transferase, beta subunit